MEKHSTQHDTRTVKPRLIIHGGAGNITPANLPAKSWAPYKANLLRIYQSTNELLQKGVSALDAATHAVTMFEDCELFNCGKGAVFTRNGTNELEASVMTTKGYHKRACALVLLKHVKNPILLAREMLIRGQIDGSGGDNGGGSGDPAGGSGGAQGHVCIGGETAECLAKEWGLEIVDEKYFWTRKRWEEHLRGLNREKDGVPMKYHDYPAVGDGEGWDGKEYLPQGTVGAVALDQEGTICVATSTGGLTNKLPIRIGDTPTIGAGFWAEQWEEIPPPLSPSWNACFAPHSLFQAIKNARSILGDCLPRYEMNDYDEIAADDPDFGSPRRIHALALSGTGNGDSFLKLCAARTAGAMVRISSTLPQRTLASAANQIAGPGGELQQSAEDRWGNGEGEGGLIGIELVGGEGKVVWDFNCGGLFRCWGDSQGRVHVGVFRESEIVP